MNDSTGQDTQTAPGVDNNGTLSTIADVFKTGINAIADAQIAKSYSVNNPSGMYTNGSLTGVPGQTGVGVSILGGNNALLLLGAGALLLAYIALRR